MQMFFVANTDNYCYLCPCNETIIIMDNQNYTQYPDLMQGKKILYVHGFASSGASGTAKNLRILLPNATVISPDLPVSPLAAMELLHQICDTEHPDLIIGTSMGGFYAEQLYGFDRILVNPAFQIGDTLKKLHGMGKQKWLNARQDGETEFWISQDTVDEFKEVMAQSFSGIDVDENRKRVYGLFGDKDPLVHTFDMFAAHYINAIYFDGEHRLNESVLQNSVIQVIRWIDDRQNGTQRPIIYFDLDGTLVDFEKGVRKFDAQIVQQYEGHPWDIPGYFAALEPMPSAVKAFRTLSMKYDTYILTSAPFSNPTAWSDKMQWVQKWLGVAAYRRLIISHHKNLNYGDYLIDDRPYNGAEDFMGAFLQFGEAPYKTWDDVMEFFKHIS